MKWQERIYTEIEIWEIISAISSAVGAIATPAAILISLRPYWRRMSLKVSVIRCLFNGEEGIWPMQLSITNLGEKQRVIKSWGVSSCDKKQKFEIEQKDIRLNENDEMAVNLLGTLTKETLKEIKAKSFKFYVCDNRGNYYYSPNYLKDDVIQTGNLDKYYS